jgi:hypothetical protein
MCENQQRVLSKQLGILVSKGCVYATGCFLVVLSIGVLLASWEDWTLLRRRDVLFGVSIRTVLVVTGLLHLAVCAWLFATQDLITQSLLLFWVGFNHIVYRIGLAWLKAATPLPILRVLGMKVGIHARTLDFCWKLFMAYLVIASLVVLALEWRRRRHLEAEELLTRWRETREQGAKSSTP